jgi:hypothetical protein
MEMLRTAVEEELNIRLPRSPRDGPMGRLIERGLMVQYPAMERKPGSAHGNGTARVYRATGLDRVTLRELMALAAECIDPEHRGTRGRKGHAIEARQTATISRAQYDKIRTMARHVGYHLLPTAETEEEAYDAVNGAYLMWDPADGPEGDWRLMYELIDMARPPARRRADDRSAARTLLDLAATHGLLLRAARSESYVIPTAWTDVQERWTAAAKHPGIAAVLGVNYWLGAISEVLGPEVDPNALTVKQMERVVEHVQDALLADRTLTTGHKASIRRAIRRVMDAGLIPECDVNGWDYRQRHRAAAWSQTVTNQIAAAVATDKRSPGLDRKKNGYAAWNHFPFPILGDPSHPYSIARAMDFHTAKGRERDRLGFRGVGTYPKESARGKSSLSQAYWAEATVKIRLGTLAVYVGWIQRHTTINLEVASLEDLLKPELVERFTDAVDKGEWCTPDQGQRALVTIGLITSPCLEDEALKKGEMEIAERFFLTSCIATGRGKRKVDGSFDGRPLYKQLAERDGAQSAEQTQKEQAEAVEAAYRDVLGVAWAYDGMTLVYENAIKRVLDTLGMSSTAELRKRWEDLDVRPTELESLRALTMWNLSLAAPLRTETHCLLECSMIKDHHGRQLTLSARAAIFKQDANGDYKVSLWREREASGFDAELMRLYLQPHGIRHRLLAPAGARFTSAPWLWVNSCTRGNAKRAKVLNATVVKACKKVIEFAALEMGLTAQQERKLLEVGRVHPFRHAVAGRLVAMGRVEDARILLHHRGTDQLYAVYAVNNADVSTGGLRAEIAAHNPSRDLGTLVESATPDELAELELMIRAKLEPG